jgi:RNA polymerase sigma-70 factor (ECF subfamily)
MNSQNRPPQDAEALVTAASNGDLDAFNQLVLIHQNLVYEHAYSLLGDPAQAEDVAQDSFIKAFQALNSFRGGSFRGWLLRIVRNSAFDMMRNFQRHPTQPLIPEDANGEELESVPWLADPAASVQDTAEQKELSEELNALMEELPEAYRTVLTLVDVYQFDYVEAAETLHIPIGTVKSRLARARFQMKDKMRTSGLFNHVAVRSGLCVAG